jgi:hypothetical protein
MVLQPTNADVIADQSNGDHRAIAMKVKTDDATDVRSSCIVSGSWSYLAPGTFKGEPWNNEASCLYQFRELDGRFHFNSPSGCNKGAKGDGDAWHSSMAVGRVISGSSGRQIEILYPNPPAINRCSNNSLGPTCISSGGGTYKCPGCHGDVCGCPGATKQCSPCNSCHACNPSTTPGGNQAIRGWLTPDCSFIDRTTEGCTSAAPTRSISHPTPGSESQRHGS